MRLGVGLAFGAAALWLAIRGTDVGTLTAALAEADRVWTAAAILSVALTVAAGIARWRLLFHPEASGLSWSALTRAYVVGQMLNIALPLRVGEVARAGWISRAQAIPVGRALATIAIERLADLVTVGAVVAGMLVLTTVPGWLATPGRVLMGTALVALGVIALVGWRGARLVETGTALTRRLPGVLGRRLERLLTTGLEGTRILDHRGMTMLAGAASVLVLLLAASTNYLLFAAFGLDVPAAAAIVLLIALQVGNTLVSVPGNVGVFHYVTVLTLGAYSVDREVAFAYAVLLHLVALAPKVLAGGMFLAFAPRR